MEEVMKLVSQIDSLNLYCERGIITICFDIYRYLIQIFIQNICRSSQALIGKLIAFSITDSGTLGGFNPIEEVQLF